MLLLVIVVFSVWGAQWKTLKADIEGCAELHPEDILPGDILFVDIYEGWCHGGFWDHLAIYIGEHPLYGESVVEATFNAGIVVTPVCEFLSRDEPAKVSVRRLKDLPDREEVIKKAMDYALAQKGKPFDFTATATLPAKINEKNMHCTELVWRSYKAGGVDLDGNNGLFIYPDDIYFSSKLEPM